jgi:hypothetical protein
VVELGCGLGDILSRIEAPIRVGYDIDSGVIRAARFLHGRHVTFVEGDAASFREERPDVLILVNWLHNVSPADLRELLLPLAAKSRYLIVDAMDQDAPASFRYRHTFDLLDGVAERVSITRVPAEPRRFLVFRVIAD